MLGFFVAIVSEHNQKDNQKLVVKSMNAILMKAMYWRPNSICLVVSGSKFDASLNRMKDPLEYKKLCKGHVEMGNLTTWLHSLHFILN